MTSPSHARSRVSWGFFQTLLVGLVLLLSCEAAFADQFYFSRTRAFEGTDGLRGATGLFLWDDATGAQSQVGGDGFHMRLPSSDLVSVDGIATDLSGTLFGFVVDDVSTPGLLPMDVTNACTTDHRSRLVSIDTNTAEVTYAGASWLDDRHIVGAAFDGQGRLWAYDCVTSEILQIDPTAGTIVGSPIATGLSVTPHADLDFAANGLGILGYNELEFITFDPDAGWVGNTPVTAVNSSTSGFDGALTPPYIVNGVSFTNNLAARSGNTAADACRLNITEARGQDELGHVNDPFFANPAIAYREADQYNPPNLPNHTANTPWYNAGLTDAARADGPALPECFYDYGDAPDSYGTLLGSSGAQHSIVAGGPFLGAGLPDFEVDGQPVADATGDNLGGTDDEDGVTVPELVRGATIDIEVEAGDVGPDTRLQGWIDWAGDGSFGPEDQVFADVVVVDGVNTLSVTVPVDAEPGDTYARFRIANESGLGATGAAGSGEVEDYQVTISAEQPTFTCDSTMYLGIGIGGGEVQLHSVETSTNPFTFPTIGDPVDGYNAIGYDPNTNYIYTVRWDATTSRQRLLRIGGDGTVQDMGEVLGGGINQPPSQFNFATGVVGADGFYYGKFNGPTAGDADAHGRMYQIDLSARTAVRIDLTLNGNPINIVSGDWAWHNGLLYAHDHDNDRLYTVDPGTGAVDIIGTSGVPTSGFGSMISATNGVFGRLNSGAFYRFDTATGAATLISDAPSGAGDGAKCPTTAVTLPADTQIIKDDGLEYYAAGDQITYEIVVFNNGPFGVQNALVNDPLPTGVTDAEWTCGDETGGATCSVASGMGVIEDVAVSLPDQASVTFMLTIEVPSGYSGDLTNTATVTNPADVPDSDPDNNEASDTDTPLEIELTGGPCWRLLSSPVDGLTYADMLENLWTQGATGSDYTGGDPNVFIWPDGETGNDPAGWQPLGDLNQPIPPGSGFLVSVYADDDYDGVDDPFPKTLTLSGPAYTGDITPAMNTTDGGWTLVGNPYGQPVDFSALTTNELTDIGYVYDRNYTGGTPGDTNGNTGGWRSTDGTFGDVTGGTFAPGQGFFVQNTGSPTSPSITFTEGSRTTGGEFYGKENEPTEPTDYLRLEVQGESLYNSVWIRFSGNGSVEPAYGDALELQPLAEQYAIFGARKTDGTLADIGHFPLPDEALQIPVHVEATRPGSYTITATDLDIPAATELYLHDLETGETVAITDSFEYTFTISEAAAKSTPDQGITACSATPVKAKTTGADRFMIITSAGTPESEVPEQVALGQNYPNPFNPATQITYQLPAASEVHLEVFDMLGRRVATLVEGTVQAGVHQVTFDAAHLTSGVYLYRLTASGPQGGQQIFTKKLTLIK